MTEYQFGVSNPALKKEEEEEVPWTQVMSSKMQNELHVSNPKCNRSCRINTEAQ